MDIIAVNLKEIGESKYKVATWGGGLPVMHRFPVVVSNDERGFVISDVKGQFLGAVPEAESEKGAMEAFFHCQKWFS